jgi:hypothetical protein
MAAVAAVDWQRHDDTTRGTLVYVGPSIENYWTVPVEILQSGAIFDFTIRYVDGTAASVSLSSSQLALAEGSYPLH